MSGYVVRRLSLKSPFLVLAFLVLSGTAGLSGGPYTPEIGSAWPPSPIRSKPRITLSFQNGSGPNNG